MPWVNPFAAAPSQALVRTTPPSDAAVVADAHRTALAAFLEPTTGQEFGKRNTMGLDDDTRRAMYERSSLIRAVFDEKANELVSAPWGIAPRDDDGDVPVWQRRGVARIFANPNATDGDYVQMLRPALIDLLVVDALALEILRDGDGDVVGLAALDGSTIRPQLDAVGRLTGYVQKILTPTRAEVTQTFRLEELCYLRGNPVTYRRYGLPLLDTLALEVGADLLAMRRNRDAFTKGYHADHILSIQEGATALSDVRAYFEARVKGQNHTLPIIAGMNPQLLTLSQSNRDMEYMQFEEWILRRICAVAQVSTDRVLPIFRFQTKASGDVQEEIHDAKSDRVLKALIAGAFTWQIVQQIDTRCAFRFEQAPLTAIERADLVQAFVAGGYPYNRVLAMLGEEPVLWPTVPGPDGEDVPVCDLPDTALVRAALGLAGGHEPGGAPAGTTGTPFASFGGQAAGVGKTAGRRPSRHACAWTPQPGRAASDPRLRRERAERVPPLGDAHAADARRAPARLCAAGDGGESGRGHADG